MTDAINFFQSLKIFGFLSNPRIETSERVLSRELVKDARQFVQTAKQESGTAAEAEKLTFSAFERAAQENLAQIAVWHYESAAYSYRRAAERYAEASRLRRDQEKELLACAEKFARAAQDAETKIEILRAFAV